jgi:hypothetical protein
MIAEHMADRVAQGVYNYMKQMLKLNAYQEGAANKLTADSITNLKLVVTITDIVAIKALIANKFATNVAVTPLADMMSGIGAKMLTKKEAAYNSAQRSMQGHNVTPPKMPAMMPKVAIKQETPEAQALKTLKIGFLGKSKEIKDQISLMHAVLKKTFDTTKIEANLEVLVAAGVACNGKLTGDIEDDYDFEDEMRDFNEDIEDALEEVNSALEVLKGIVDIFDEAKTVVIGTIDEAISELP